MKKLALILFLVSIFTAILSFNLSRQNLAESELYLKKYNTINVILDSKTNLDNVILKQNQNYFRFQNGKTRINQDLRGKTKEITILSEENPEDKIQNIIIYNGQKTQYLGGLSGFEKKEDKICNSKDCIKYYSYSYKINNQNTKLNTICAFFITFIEGHGIYFLSYILLFISLVYFQNSLWLKRRFIFPLILILAFVLRVNIIYPEPILDECFTLWVSNHFEPFSMVFSDAGNPPFFYIFAKLYGIIFGFDIVRYKVLSIIVSIFSVIFIWIFLNKKFNTKTANIASFVASINLISIYYAQEIRCYSFMIMLTPLIVWVIFNIIQKKKNKYFVLYTILNIIAINTHYYEVLFIFTNFIFVTLYFVLKKDKTNIVKFLLCNFIIALSFLPFFIITAYKKALLDQGFNIWLEDISFRLIKDNISFIFGSILSFFIFVFFFVKSLTQKLSKRKIFLFYCFYSIFGVFLCAVILSYLIRPIIYERYFCEVLPLVWMFFAVIFSQNFKQKIYILLCVLWLFSFNFAKFQPTKKRIHINEYNMFDIAGYISQKTDKNIYIISKSSIQFFMKMKNNNIPKRAKMLFLDIVQKDKIQKNLNAKIKEIKEKDKNSLIFTTLLDPTKENIENTKRTCYYNSSLDYCVWMIDE